ncbi:MAG TPA: hypothetical protein VL404_05770 [Candidatus Eisenbacteria bacterium]|nr:hypothetical protein [Candidatus Eisenbacteria bacterium]
MELKKRYKNLVDSLLSEPILFGEDPFRRRRPDRPKRPAERKIRFDWRDK